MRSAREGDKALNTKEHLLTCLAEECAEIQKAVTKSLRFGLDDRKPQGLTTNLEDIAIELTDMLAVVELLNEIEPGIRPIIERHVVEAKKDKVRRFMEYAKDRGTLAQCLECGIDMIPGVNHVCAKYSGEPTAYKSA